MCVYIYWDQVRYSDRIRASYSVLLMFVQISSHVLNSGEHGLWQRHILGLNNSKKAVYRKENCHLTLNPCLKRMPHTFCLLRQLSDKPVVKFVKKNSCTESYVLCIWSDQATGNPLFSTVTTNSGLGPSAVFILITHNWKKSTLYNPLLENCYAFGKWRKNNSSINWRCRCHSTVSGKLIDIVVFMFVSLSTV